MAWMELSPEERRDSQAIADYKAKFAALTNLANEGFLDTPDNLLKEFGEAYTLATVDRLISAYRELLE